MEILSLYFGLVIVLALFSLVAAAVMEGFTSDMFVMVVLAIILWPLIFLFLVGWLVYAVTHQLMTLIFVKGGKHGRRSKES